MAHSRAGKLRALCTTGAQKFALLADQPTCDSTVPGLVVVNWWGVLFPTGVSRPIVDKFHVDMVKAVQDPVVVQKFADLGVDAVTSTPAQFGTFIRTEMDKFSKLIKEANIKVNP